MNGAREASEQFEFESLNSGTASPIEGQKVSRMKPGHHQRRLFQHLLGHPDFAHGLHTQQITRKAESLIKMGYIDESWRVTEEGKSKLLREQQQQQIQESSNEPSQMIGADINNAATQAELLRAEQLSLQHNYQLTFYAQAKAQQIDCLQARLQKYNPQSGHKACCYRTEAADLASR